MIGVTRARTAGAIGRELMDTRYSAREVTSERREIHCRSSVEFIYRVRVTRARLVPACFLHTRAAGRPTGKRGLRFSPVCRGVAYR